MSPTQPLNIVVADDSALLREGVAGLLERRGHEIVGRAYDTASLSECMSELAARGQLPDVLITDVRMPPTMTDDGLRCAVEFRQVYPQLAVMVVSQYVAPSYAVELFRAPGGGTGYVLKDRVSEVTEFLASLDVVARGGTVIDPEVANALMSAGRSGLGELTPREREVLMLMSRGMSNWEIAEHLVVSSATVAKHVSNIFLKLRLDPAAENRRVKAILEFLSGQPSWGL